MDNNIDYIEIAKKTKEELMAELATLIIVSARPDERIANRVEICIRVDKNAIIDLLNLDNLVHEADKELEKLHEQLGQIFKDLHIKLANPDLSKH